MSRSAIVLFLIKTQQTPRARIKDPHENSPVVSAPTTRSGGGSRTLMSVTCAVTSDWRKFRTCRLKSETSTCEVAVRFCANVPQLAPSNPQRIKTTRRAARNLAFRKNEQNTAARARRDGSARVMVSANQRHSLDVCAAATTTNLQASSTVRKSTWRRQGEGHSRGARPPGAFDHCLRREPNTGRSAIARCVLPLPDNSWRVRHLL